MSDLTCDDCNAPATHVMDVVCTKGTGGPIPLCLEHATSWTGGILADGNTDMGDGLLIYLKVGVLG